MASAIQQRDGINSGKSGNSGSGRDRDRSFREGEHSRTMGPGDMSRSHSRSGADNSRSGASRSRSGSQLLHYKLGREQRERDQVSSREERRRSKERSSKSNSKSNSKDPYDEFDDPDLSRYDNISGGEGSVRSYRATR